LLFIKAADPSVKNVSKSDFANKKKHTEDPFPKIIFQILKNIDMP